MVDRLLHSFGFTALVAGLYLVAVGLAVTV
jgi:hypothetical protein